MLNFDDFRKFKHSLGDYEDMRNEEKNNNEDKRQPFGIAVILLGLIFKIKKMGIKIFAILLAK